MSAEYFLDTNIIVYAHDSAEQVKQARAQELIFSGMREHNTAVSAQVLSEFLITVTRKIAVPFSPRTSRTGRNTAKSSAGTLFCRLH